MSEREKLPKNDELREQFDGIDRMVTAPDKLVEAVKSGTPLPQTANRYTAGFHVRKFAKAVAVYVVAISLFLGLLLLLPGLFEGTSPVGGTVSTDVVSLDTVDSDRIITEEPVDERDLLNYGLPPKERFIWQYIWKVVKNDVPEEYTINDLEFGAFRKRYDDVIVCYFNYDHCVEPIITGLTPVYSETVAGYEFRCGYNYGLSVFFNYAHYDLPTAYEQGVLTKEQVRKIWEDYKAMHACYYQIPPDGVIPTPE